MKKASWGFAEVEARFSHFNRVTVVLSPCSLPGGWGHSLGREGLSLLISGLIIMTKADVLTLVPTAGRVEAELANLGFGTARDLWTPNLAMARLLSPTSGLKIQTRDIDAVSWWERAEDDRKVLSYLEKRRENEEQAQKPPRKKPRSLMARLNSFLRWS